jgi:hypothetical protein
MGRRNWQNSADFAEAFVPVELVGPRWLLSILAQLAGFERHHLLDALTIFFIVAGLALLWLNLRAWRRRTVGIAPPQHEEYLVGTFDADIVGLRAQAEECLKQAESSVSETDRETWLRMAAEWIKLVEDAERRRSDK